MPTIFEHKEQPVTETPILLFECELRNGAIERWSTHRVAVDGFTYEPRVLRHNLFEMQVASDQGVDAIPKVSITLANADSHFSELERTVGIKGASVTVRFAFYRLKDSTAETESTVLFRGRANPPDEITESTFRLSAVNRMSMQRVLLPFVRVQKRCPWEFPSTAGQREEAVHGGAAGIYSRFFRCGYSADVAGGTGNLNAGAPFTSCGFTRNDCEVRGMFAQDASSNVTRRFGGVEFVPASILVRSYGEKGSHVSAVSENEARYNDFVPLVYGTAWHSPLIVFARNDGNLTRMEVLLAMGEIQSVLAVLVNDIEIPLGRAGANMTGTGWFNVVSLGNRTGGFNPDFRDESGSPLGDPYGSMAYLSVVIPNRINDGRSLPTVKVLMEGQKLLQYATDGSALGTQFSSNPAWILLDILRRCGWQESEILLPSFARVAAYCDEQIATKDLYGNSITTPRFQCNFVLKRRRTAADTIRGIRNAARLYLTYGDGGLLELRVENTLALQQPVKPESSNSVNLLDGGWPKYEFGDGSEGVSGILRRDNGTPSLRMWSRSMTDTPNRFTVEFQDAFNEFQQDSLSLTDVEDVAQAGQEITGPFQILGIPNYDQAARVLKFNLDKSVEGNTYLEFETSVRGIGVQPGDIVSLTYLKEGFTRQPFRVLRVAPGINYQTAVITAQIHKDDWYADTNGQALGSGGRRQSEYGIGLPRPLVGDTLDAHGDVQFGVVEIPTGNTDGSSTVEAQASFLTPPVATASRNGIPFVSLAPTLGSSGTLPGDQTLYYAASALDASGEESGLSFVVRAQIPPGPATNSVVLTGLRFSPSTTGFRVYRGPSPTQLFRIGSDQTIAASFTDAGLANTLAAPPDANYHHANFYWRLELQPEQAGTIHSGSTIGNNALSMLVNEYQGMTVRVTRGKGAGQERGIAANTATALTVLSAWDIQPDATSYFVVAESGWHAGASGANSPVQFEIPNRAGEIVHVSGRAANVNDKESPVELATVTRWVIGGAGLLGVDEDVPPQPAFGAGLPVSGGGVLELSGISFVTLENTRAITAGTFAIHYWGELSGQPQARLSAAMTNSATTIHLTEAAGAELGGFIQVELEVMRVDSVSGGGLQYEVTRGVHASTALAHDINKLIYTLRSKIVVAPFTPNFFGSPASASWSYPVLLPGVRVASVELFVTNVRGNSPTRAICLTPTIDGGLRTHSGGQYSIEVEGFLAIENGVAPDLVVEATHTVRDVFAVVRQAPTGAAVEIRLNQNGVLYCALMVDADSMISSSVDGFALPPLLAGARLGADITGVGTTTPGADLTIIVRL